MQGSKPSLQSSCCFWSSSLACIVNHLIFEVFIITRERNLFCNVVTCDQITVFMPRYICSTFFHNALISWYGAHPSGIVWLRESSLNSRVFSQICGISLPAYCDGSYNTLPHPSLVNRYISVIVIYLHTKTLQLYI